MDETGLIMIGLKVLNNWNNHRHYHGNTLPEYVFIMALLAVVCIVALQNMGESLQNNYGSLKNTIEAVPVNNGNGGNGGSGGGGGAGSGNG